MNIGSQYWALGDLWPVDGDLSVTGYFLFVIGAKLLTAPPYLSTLLLYRLTALLLLGINTHEAPFATTIFKFDNARDLGEERVVAADAYVYTRFELGAALADQDGAAQNRLATEALDSQSLRGRITAVAGAAY